MLPNSSKATTFLMLSATRCSLIASASAVRACSVTVELLQLDRFPAGGTHQLQRIVQCDGPARHDLRGFCRGLESAIYRRHLHRAHGDTGENDIHPPRW